MSVSIHSSRVILLSRDKALQKRLRRALPHGGLHVVTDVNSLDQGLEEGGIMS